MDYFDTKGIQTYVNPMQSDGQLIHSVNMVSNPYLAKSKRSGYNSFLGTPDTAQVQSLLYFPNIGNSGSLNLFRASGSALYHSIQGTGAWTLSGNGTISDGAHFGAAVGNGGTVFIGGDGVGSTRHSTNGTSFTNTTLAPVAAFFVDYQNAVYAAGSASNLFKSTDNDATNWNTSGTSNSISFRIPGGGILKKIFKTADRLIATKTNRTMYQWDGYQLIDMATRYGPSSPYSVAEVEGYNFWINQFGHDGFNGSKPQLLSNAVQRYFYNRNNTGIAGTAFSSIVGESHIYDYFAAIGTVTDDFTGRQINNAILNYNYQKNEYLVWQFANNPTAMLSYTDANGSQQFIFGDANGQCYQLDQTATTDNGNVINTELVYLFNYGKQSGAASVEKKWNYIRLFLNPGCEVNIQFALANTFTYERLQWKELVDHATAPSRATDDGILELRFPQGSQSRLLFIRIYEASENSKWTYYGCSIDAEPLPVK